MRGMGGETPQLIGAPGARKSQAAPPDVRGDAVKHDAYREAFSRMAAATAQGFFIEALAIQESIINDRLLSWLEREGHLTASRDERHWPTLRRSIALWRRVDVHPVADGDVPDLARAIEIWIGARNRAVHHLVRPPIGADLVSVDVFLEQARRAAEEGLRLCRAMTRWSAARKRARRARSGPTRTG
jgi:hypothetical protein